MTPTADSSAIAHRSLFGAVIRTRRMEQGLTLDALAATCGTSKSALSGIETGRIAPPSAPIIKALGRALGLEPAALERKARVEKSDSSLREDLLTLMDTETTPESMLAIRSKYANDSSPTHFGQLLKTLRQRLGYTLKDLQRRCDLKKGYISGIENSKVSPPHRSAIPKLAQALNYDAQKLLMLEFVDKTSSEHRPYFFELVYGQPAVRAQSANETPAIDRNRSHRSPRLSAEQKESQTQAGHLAHAVTPVSDDKKSVEPPSRPTGGNVMKRSKKSKKGTSSSNKGSALANAVAKHVKLGKGDSDIAKALKVSLWKVRHLRSNVLGIKKPGGGFGKRKKKSTAKVRKPAARKARSSAPSLPIASNGYASHLRAALRDLTKARTQQKRLSDRELEAAQSALRTARADVTKAEQRVEAIKRNAGQHDRTHAAHERQLQAFLKSIK